ncbi:hypothetical protein OG871_16950 [Kitasatospora sp. NBC_00374]|uniref:hypothetical protein n=1 Tax=Kitasatospora sp. NBC_00374 TaxID=2975964 RepID=UPI003252AD44
MSKQREATAEGVGKAFSDWLYHHEVSVPDTMGIALGEAFSRWLVANSDGLIAAIAEAVTPKAVLIVPPVSGPEA